MFSSCIAERSLSIGGIGKFIQQCIRQVKGFECDKQRRKRHIQNRVFIFLLKFHV